MKNNNELLTNTEVRLRNKTGEKLETINNNIKNITGWLSMEHCIHRWYSCFIAN